MYEKGEKGGVSDGFEVVSVGVRDYCIEEWS